MTQKIPVSVLVIGCSQIVVSAVLLLLYLYKPIPSTNPFFALTALLTGIGIGIGLLKGREIARIMYLWIVPVPLIYHGALNFYSLISNPLFLGFLILYGTGFFFLINKNANIFFGTTPSVNSLKESFLISIWFCFLTFPIMAIKVNTIDKVIQWRFRNILLVWILSFSLSRLWRYLIQIKELGKAEESQGIKQNKIPMEALRWIKKKEIILTGISGVTLLILFFPFVFSIYHTNIMINALIYVMLGLGLNIVVGVAGLLDLGYVAFYAVGAYTYALLNTHFAMGFWISLPVSAALAAIFGIILGFPVLRLKGDYLAIVTLGFGEIIRLILENWNEFSFGPSGIANIPKPGLFGFELDYKSSITFIYFLMIAMTLFTVFMVNRLQNSRIGRAWIALREDDVACQAMGIDKRKTKLTAFALGATWAGAAGCLFAAKTSFINPASFTIWESIIILCIVVLGGMGSIIGVIIGSFVLILLPEYLRAFSEFRMLAFGIILVSMMVFRPEGIFPSQRRTYQFKKGPYSSIK